MKPIVFHPDAQEEFDQAIEYYEEQLEGLGLELAAEVEKAAKLIGRSPGRFPIYLTTGFRQKIVHKFPFVVIYRELDDKVWIAAVAHQRREPGYWLLRSHPD